MSFSTESSFYIGTYTKDPLLGGIWRSHLNLETGALSAPNLVAPSSNPSFVTRSPDSKFLYAVEENKEGTVAAYELGSTGQLTLLNRQPSGGKGPCHVEVDRLGKTLFTANYGSGTIALYPISENGSLGRF